ncbi:hypothetical protein [Photobacterium sp. 1_MG-2023]|uniref:hypothetical protein n=1 Tax=Photobacterium sp. 1_MG-2023 TaxID=3062646 RepID=UPI0026E19A8E|nr:hypothetical protein [Photobacterium sp. 1_MG-2023]MDO6705509.1 hypothetical protein [Photobacterium sp. 1_MG-2023]
MTPEAISALELTRIALEFVRFTNTFWGVIATVTIALLGWVFGSNKKWVFIQRVATSVAYGLIACINCLAQLRFNDLINASIADLKAMSASHPEIANLHAQLTHLGTLEDWVIVLIYAVIATAVIVITLRQNQFVHQG